MMLGEGFDHPPLSVAAIFRPYRSLAPYIQFVGRVMRTIKPNDPNHANNQGYVVSHVGLNNGERWDDFRELDDPDKKLVHEWTSGPAVDRTAKDRLADLTSGAAQRFDYPVANDEVVSHFLSQSFLDPNDDRVIDAWLDATGPGGFTFRELSISAEQLKAMQASRAAREEAPAASIPSQPQIRRQTLRSCLDSRSKAVHYRILVDLGLSRAGYDISRTVAAARGNNADALYAILNLEIARFVGEKPGTRRDWALDQYQAAYDELDVIGDEVASRLRRAMEARDASN
ncbi:MAG: hypothetical protein ACRDRK_13210 [Pseudonocardia sp.]